MGDSRLTVQPDAAASAEGRAFRDHDGEQALLAELELALAQFGLRPGTPHVRLGGFDTVRFSTELLPLLASHPQVELEITGEPADYREVGDSLVIGVSVDQVATDNDWFDLGITISVEGRQIPFIDVFLALSRGETYLLLPDGAYFSLEKPELQHLARLIAEARALQDSPSDPLRISRYQAAPVGRASRPRRGQPSGAGLATAGPGPAVDRHRRDGRAAAGAERGAAPLPARRFRLAEVPVGAPSSAASSPTTWGSARRCSRSRCSATPGRPTRTARRS